MFHIIIKTQKSVVDNKFKYRKTIEKEILNQPYHVAMVGFKVLQSENKDDFKIYTFGSRKDFDSFKADFRSKNK